jgi:hypothetical protein
MFSVKNDQIKDSVKSRNRLTLPNRQLFTHPLSEKKPTGSIARDIPSDLVYYSDDISEWILVSGGSGIAGETGETGVTGAQGETGPTGSMGMMGSLGPVGETGVTGPTGSIGPTGETGVTGPVGDVGPVGETGPSGATGAVGVTGPIGGSTGETGETGPTGPPGTGGPIGATGEIGVTGPVGETGPTGDLGVTGPMGADGIAGVQGVVGPTGLVGSAGVAGPTGVEGPVGETGPQGETGPAGAPGAIQNPEVNNEIPHPMTGINTQDTFNLQEFWRGGCFWLHRDTVVSNIVIRMEASSGTDRTTVFAFYQSADGTMTQPLNLISKIVFVPPPIGAGGSNFTLSLGDPVTGNPSTITFREGVLMIMQGVPDTTAVITMKSYAHGSLQTLAVPGSLFPGTYPIAFESNGSSPLLVSTTPPATLDLTDGTVFEPDTQPFCIICRLII